LGCRLSSHGQLQKLEPQTLVQPATDRAASRVLKLAVVIGAIGAGNIRGKLLGR